MSKKSPKNKCPGTCVIDNEPADDGVHHFVGYICMDHREALAEAMKKAADDDRPSPYERHLHGYPGVVRKAVQRVLKLGTGDINQHP